MLKIPNSLKANTHTNDSLTLCGCPSSMTPCVRFCPRCWMLQPTFRLAQSEWSTAVSSRSGSSRRRCSQHWSCRSEATPSGGLHLCSLIPRRDPGPKSSGGVGPESSGQGSGVEAIPRFWGTKGWCFGIDPRDMGPSTSLKPCVHDYCHRWHLCAH